MSAGTVIGHSTRIDNECYDLLIMFLFILVCFSSQEQENNSLHSTATSLLRTYGSSPFLLKLSIHTLVHQQTVSYSFQPITCLLSRFYRNVRRTLAMKLKDIHETLKITKTAANTFTLSLNDKKYQIFTNEERTLDEILEKIRGMPGSTDEIQLEHNEYIRRTAEHRSILERQRNEELEDVNRMQRTVGYGNLRSEHNEREQIKRQSMREGVNSHEPEDVQRRTIASIEKQHHGNSHSAHDPISIQPPGADKDLYPGVSRITSKTGEKGGGMFMGEDDPFFRHQMDEQSDDDPANPFSRYDPIFPTKNKKKKGPDPDHLRKPGGNGDIF